MRVGQTYLVDEVAAVLHGLAQVADDVARHVAVGVALVQAVPESVIVAGQKEPAVLPVLVDLHHFAVVGDDARHVGVARLVVVARQQKFRLKIKKKQSP